MQSCKLNLNLLKVIIIDSVELGQKEAECEARKREAILMREETDRWKARAKQIFEKYDVS
jgi:hypothetical protein